MVTPIDGRCGFDPSFGEQVTRGRKICAAHTEGMMTLAERITNSSRTFIGREGSSRDLKESKVLTTAIQQDLITEARHDFESKDIDVETLSPSKIGNFNAKMIELLESHARRLSKK